MGRRVTVRVVVLVFFLVEVGDALMDGTPPNSSRSLDDKAPKRTVPRPRLVPLRLVVVEIVSETSNRSTLDDVRLLAVRLRAVGSRCVGSIKTSSSKSSVNDSKEGSSRAATEALVVVTGGTTDEEEALTGPRPYLTNVNEAKLT